VSKNDLAAATWTSYRRVLNGIWRPHLGPVRFLDVRYSSLIAIADAKDWSKKSYNNAISVLRRAFKFGYRDHPEQHDPTRELKGARMRRKDRPLIDPFTIREAEALIAAIHRDWGEAQGNYDEFRFFTGVRPSEQIALVVADFDRARGTVTVTKACVAGHNKDCTKTGEDRRIVLCPRALAVLQRQLALREQLRRAGKLDHEYLFFKANGAPIRNLQYPYTRWRRSLARLPQIRYRKPYCARHSSVSWDLMIGRSALWVARQHGHSIATMLRAYAAWTDGATEADIGAIRAAMARTAPMRDSTSARSREPQAARSTIRAFEVERLPASFANGFASGHHRPTAKCVNQLGLIWRRERDSKALEDQQVAGRFRIPVPCGPITPPDLPPDLPPVISPHRCAPVRLTKRSAQEWLHRFATDCNCTVRHAPRSAMTALGQNRRSRNGCYALAASPSGRPCFVTAISLVKST
jgi:integrase